MSKRFRVQDGGTVACPACGKLCSARGGVSTHYRFSRLCLPTASGAVGIGCQERRSNVPSGTQLKPADSSIHDSDEADYPNADNEGSDLDTILPGDSAAIDHGNSQLTVAFPAQCNRVSESEIPSLSQLGLWSSQNQQGTYD